MDFKVASSIYRKPWLIERGAALSYLDTLEQIKAGTAKFSKPKPTSLQFFGNSSDLIVAPSDRYSAKDHPGYEGKSIAVLVISGPLMKEDYCGWYGTVSLRNEFNRISASESVQTIVLHIDSPGGQVDGTEAFADAIAASSKEVIALVDGTCASAAYWLASAADKIIATANTDIIGSIGTMISFYDRSAYMEEMGIVLREYYADASSDKNKMAREAIEGKGRLLIEGMLNPMNDIFLAAVTKNRGKVLNQKETLTGKTFLSAKSLEYGLVDEISSADKTFDTLIQKQNKTSITMKISSTFTFILGLLGIKASGSDKVELSEEQLTKIDGSLKELADAKAKVTELEAAATASTEKITGLEASVTAVTKERDTAKEKITELEAEVKKLGALDAGALSKTSGQGDRFEEPKNDPAEMAFQKELNDKL